MNRIMSVGVLSFGKFMGVIGLFVGLIIGVIYGIALIFMGIVGAAAGAQQNEAGAAAGIGAFGVVGGIFVIVLTPIFYGAFMFVAGLIYGLIFNLALRFCGGLEIEIR